MKWKDDIEAEVREMFQLAVHSAERKVLDYLPFTLGWCLFFQSESESESSSSDLRLSGDSELPCLRKVTRSLNVM